MAIKTAPDKKLFNLALKEKHYSLGEEDRLTLVLLANRLDKFYNRHIAKIRKSLLKDGFIMVMTKGEYMLKKTK